MTPRMCTMKYELTWFVGLKKNLVISYRNSECGGVRGEAEDNPGVPQHPSGQPPAPGPPQQTLGPGQPAQPGRPPAAGTGLCWGRLQGLPPQVHVSPLGDTLCLPLDPWMFSSISCSVLQKIHTSDWCLLYQTTATVLKLQGPLSDWWN